RRTLFRTQEPGVPDGIALDSDGYLWVAMWEGMSVLRYAFDGTCDARIRVPSRRPTSCAFGGPDFGTLYVTTATVGRPDDEMGWWVQIGGVFEVRLGCRGRPPHRFKG